MTSDLREVARQLMAMRRRKAALYKPHPKQAEFLAMGAVKAERCLLGANQSGKTLTVGYEAYCHLTGLYPGWWKGRRFEHPTSWWVASETSERTRDLLQYLLL